jgi:hypothetical protein
LLPVFPADHRTASMSKSHQLSAGGAATKGEQRQDHPAGGTLVRVTRMAPPGGREAGFSKERRLEPQITVGVRHEALVRREAPLTEGGGSPPRWVVAATRQELSAA